MSKRTTRKRTRKSLTELPPGTKVTRLPPGRAKGAELPGEFVHTAGHIRGRPSVDPAAVGMYWGFRNPKGRKLTYKKAQGIILDALEQAHWTVKRGLKVPHATGMAGYPRLYFKPQAIYVDFRPPFSLGAARSLHVDPRHIACLSMGDIPWQLKELARAYSNPMPGVPGGGIAECIEEMSTRPDVDDPGALCASIAQKRGEFGWRSLPRRPQKTKSVERRKTLRSIMGRALR